mgnify:CR=1 FL=1|jgi:hypothetical protein|tara:strand:- start:9788 stop:10291 length:504 start_codon:yes stop_codon:yes gene_type:complete
MKTFKELKNRITESSGEHTFGGGFGDTFVKTNPNSAIKAYGKGIFDIGKEDNLKRVNAFSNAFWKGIKDEPNAHLGVFKTKLNLLGLDFDYDKNTMLRDGQNSFELSRLGGAFGKSPETPHDEFDNENGFENGDSYNLNINMGDVNGTCDITANVVKSEGIDGEFEA